MVKLIYEKTLLKVLVDRKGILLGVTTRSRAYFFFVTAKYTGIKTGPTTDPYPGIVEICNYDLDKIVTEWDHLYKYRLTQPKTQPKKTVQRT
jgi:hypothetical protein